MHLRKKRGEEEPGRQERERRGRVSTHLQLADLVEEGGPEADEEIADKVEIDKRVEDEPVQEPAISDDNESGVGHD